MKKRSWLVISECGLNGDPMPRTIRSLPLERQARTVEMIVLFPKQRVTIVVNQQTLDAEVPKMIGLALGVG